MSIPMIETYQVEKMELGIEDYKDKRKGHFLPDLAIKRYHCWVNGDGLPQADTLQEARQILFDWAIDRLHEKVKKLSGELYTCLNAQQLLNNDIDNLQQFIKLNR
jgi:hypothetical protein